MSLSSIILAFAPAIAARFKTDVEVTRLKARVAELEIELAEAKARSDVFQTAVAAIARREHIQRNREFEQTVLAQYAQQQASAMLRCNCVPARHDMLLGGN